jgi:hypothetical protein
VVSLLLSSIIINLNYLLKQNSMSTAFIASLHSVRGFSTAMKLFGICLTALIVTTRSFSCPCQLERQPRNTILRSRSKNKEEQNLIGQPPSSTITRTVFFQKVGVVGVATATATLLLDEKPAQARGRATLEFAYDKYTPRILAGGNFYKAQLKSMIAGNDFAGIKLALAEPPKKRSVNGHGAWWT